MTSRLISRYNPPGLVLERNYGNVGFVLFLPGVLYSTVHESVESVVLAHSDIGAGIVDSTPLADQDVACFYGFLAEFLDSESFAVGLTTVLGT